MHEIRSKPKPSIIFIQKVQVTFHDDVVEWKRKRKRKGKGDLGGNALYIYLDGISIG